MKSPARPIACTIAVLSLLAGPNPPAHALSPDEVRAATEESRRWPMRSSHRFGVS